MSSALSLGGSGVYLLETSILILSLRGDQAIRARLATTTRLDIPNSALGELYFGAYPSPTRSTAALADSVALATTNTILGTDALTADIYGRIKRELRRDGRTMPENDLWIAATAIQYDVTLAARDVNFIWITGLRSEQW
jgi:tRNA(fMet)-specific endonuclease VapC